MSQTATKARPEPSRLHMTLEDLARAAPISATQDMPKQVLEILRKDSGLYVRSESKPAMQNFVTEQVPGAPGIWRVLDTPGGEELRTTIPGRGQTEVEAGGGPAPASRDLTSTEGYRPPWVDLQYLPRLAPFRMSPWPAGPWRQHMFLEPRAQEAIRLSYPWRTVGKVFSTGGPTGPEGGIGVLVGPNLLLTASHVAPWGNGPWSMEFIPAFRMGDRPFGSSFVEEFRGYRTEPEASGLDYVVCKLYNPLGQALGWMGTQSWGDEDEYKRRRFQSSGYPDSFGGRPAVEFDIRIVDIDSDSPGLELELPIGHPLTAGWSGGPLWYFPNQEPFVVGVQSGSEKDEVDPRRHVTAGGRGMVDLVKFGLENWQP
jgi:hypothetical protein